MREGTRGPPAFKTAAYPPAIAMCSLPRPTCLKLASSSRTLDRCCSMISSCAATFSSIAAIFPRASFSWMSRSCFSLLSCRLSCLRREDSSSNERLLPSVEPSLWLSSVT